MLKVRTVSQLGDNEVEFLNGVDAREVTAFLPARDQGVPADFHLSVNLVTVTCVWPPLTWTGSGFVTF